MEYSAAITIILLLVAASVLVILFFKMKWRSHDEYPPVAATMVDHILSSVVFRENALKLSEILLKAYRTNQRAEMQACNKL